MAPDRRVRDGMRHVRGLRIGLLGGSFNPAHEGHRHISLTALKRLGLDEVWWLVSPQNPLKSDQGMAPLASRMYGAIAASAHPRIRVTDIERHLETRYTRDTVRALKRRFPEHRFVWLMGADNLAQLPRWARWPELVESVPVAVFDRAPYSHNALSGQAATRYRRALLPQDRARDLWRKTPPALTFIRMRRSALSATAIRDGTMTDNGLAQGPRIRRMDIVTGTKGPDRNLLDLIETSLDDDQAERIVRIDLQGKTEIADYMLVASGRSSRHVAAIADHIVEKLKASGHGRPKVEGMPTCDWVLVDAGDIIVHVFRPEVREFYNLEKMWAVDLGTAGEQAAS